MKCLHQCSIDDITQPRSGLRDGDQGYVLSPPSRNAYKHFINAHPTRKDSREKNHYACMMIFIKIIDFYAPKGHISSWPKWPGR